MADKPWPLICHVLLPGTLWRGMAHGKEGRFVDLGEIGILEHARKGIEVVLFAVNERMYLPYPADDTWVLDQHLHVRIGDRDGNLKLTLASA